MSSRYAGTKELASALHRVTKPLFQKRGFVENKIITDWPQIVGSSYSNSSTPRKLTFPRDKRTDGVLQVEVYDSGLAMEMTYMEPIILEKIACYFGYKAITRLKIIQKPGQAFEEKTSLKHKEIPLTPAQEERLRLSLHNMEDEALHRALESLGKHLMQGE